MNSFRQNTANKTENQISYTSYHIFINPMHNTHKKVHQHSEVQDDAGSQTKDIQLTLDEVDFDQLSDDDSNKYQKSNQQTGMQQLSGINFEYNEPASFESPKKFIKKSGKRDNVQVRQFKNQLSFPTFKNQKNNQRSNQYFQQDSQQMEQEDEEIQITQVARPNFKKNQAKDQIDFSQMIRVKPEIQIYEDKTLKQSLTISKVTEEKNTEFNEVKFSILISLIPDRLENYIKNNVAAQSRIVPNTNFNSINNTCNFSSYSENRSESSEVMQGQIKQAQKMQKQKQKPALNTKSKIKRIDNAQQQIQPIQMKESKIKNNFNRQTILKASMASESSLKNSQNQQDLFYRNNRQMVNLAQVSLEDLVRELYLKKIINEGLYKQFIQNHSIHDLKDYIIKFQLGKLHLFDYQKIKFTLLDHRKIAELLVNLYVDRYMIGKCYNSDPQVQNFLTKLYDLEAQEYYYLYKRIDNISGLKWWSKILITQDERLMQVNKERRITRRKAEKASLAVQELIQNAKKKSTVSDSKLSQSQANNDKLPTSIYKDHTTFFGQSEQQKELYKKRRQQIRELAQIRQMVSNNFSTKVKQNQQSETNKPSMRKKIRFY